MYVGTTVQRDSPMPSIYRIAPLIFFGLLLSACKQPLERVELSPPAFDAATLAQMRSTEASNMDVILENIHLQPSASAKNQTQALLASPYQPNKILSAEACKADVNCNYAQQHYYMNPPRFPARAEVYEWWTSRSTQADQAAVCGLRFEDSSQTRYSLKTFPNRAALEAEPGYLLTHFQDCGACSTLQDLAVYGELDLTRMAKTCSKRMGLDAKLACMEEIGFTPACAASWAYNGDKTGQTCALTCVSEYGLLPLLTGTETTPPVNENGELNACLLCDERMSGPGFQYSAGRTRRNSGIVSEIDRPDAEIYPFEHHYFTF
ncbi:Hypothetical protein HDN1F_13430 [gamma proteobacterium HdN1]|nr:Hypothetical protein HDN1F_13430 [gamma proteobacterium HdN1]